MDRPTFRLTSRDSRLNETASESSISKSGAVQVFGRRTPQRVEGFVIPASKNLHTSRPLACLSVSVDLVGVFSAARRARQSAALPASPYLTRELT